MIATAVRPTTTVRTATVEDLPSLAALANEFYSQSDVLKTFDIERFCTLWKALLANGSGVILLLESSGEIIGTIAGVVYPEQYSSELLCQEFFLFVRAESRGGFGLLKLYRAFERWAKEHGCSEIRLGHLHDLQPEALGSLYVRLGFRHTETLYAKELR